MAAMEYWIWLSAAPISARAKAAVLAGYGDAQAAFFAPEGQLRELAGLSRQEAELLERRDMSAVGRILDACREQGIRAVSYQDAAYPARLKNIAEPPVVLYSKGELAGLEEEPLIAVIGTRQATPYGLRMGRDLAWQIASGGGVVVSLLTRGIDAAAGQAALRAGGKCVGVLGTAHELAASRLADDVAATGALISEYPPGTERSSHHFRERNRIAAGLSIGVVVIEAPEKSGTRLFAREALEQGKEIFAVPGNADAESSAGTLALLKEGAKLVTCGWDVLEEFEALYPGKLRPTGNLHAPETSPEQEEAAAPAKKQTPEKRKPAAVQPPAPKREPPDLRRQLSELSADQLRILTSMEKQPMHIDDIIEATGLPTATVLAQLTFMEIKGYVRREPGRRFALNIDRRNT